MNKQRLGKRYVRAIILCCLINLCILCCWFFIRIRPLIPKLQHFKEEVFTEEIKKYYDSYDDLLNDINKTSSNHNILINVEDINGTLVIENKKENGDIPLISEIIKVKDDVYLIDIYFDNYASITKIVIELLLLQSALIILILLITVLYTREIVLKPINRLIEEIRDYKFGKKPKKRELNTEFDLISNEFSNLTDLLDEEKAEQTRIIASISHDIKTPLTSIIGYSDLLKEQNLDKEAEKYNEKINAKALNIKELLSTFDDYLLNQEKIELNRSLVQVKDIVNQLNNDYKIELENNNIDFSITTKIPEKYISIDILKMKRVVSNMVSNSTRYLKNGGKIMIDISEEDKNYKFVIKDNGPGVNEKIINKIFDPLFTTDSSRKISGLGLSICKEFIEMHGGEINAYNDNGLVIEFTIPKGNSK